MKTTFALLVIWFGSGNTQVYTTTRMESMAECETARIVVIEHYADRWQGPGTEDVECILVER